jgi:lysozyme
MNPPLTYSKAGAKLTESFEGLRLTAYRDVADVLSIGYGHTGPDVHEGMTITPEQAEGLLMDDIQKASSCVNTAVTYQLTQPEFDAVVDLTYNIGCAAFCGSTMRRLLNEGDIMGASKQFELWDHAGGKVVAGLLRRRIAEAAEFDTA